VRGWGVELSSGNNSFRENICLERARQCSVVGVGGRGEIYVTATRITRECFTGAPARRKWYGAEFRFCRFPRYGRSYFRDDDDYSFCAGVVRRRSKIGSQKQVVGFGYPWSDYFGGRLQVGGGEGVRSFPPPPSIPKGPINNCADSYGPISSNGPFGNVVGARRNNVCGTHEHNNTISVDLLYERRESNENTKRGTRVGGYVPIMTNGK